MQCHYAFITIIQSVFSISSQEDIRIVSVADRIKFLREQAHLTQADLAKKLGITRSGVNAWEAGISVPSTQYIVELSKFFHVSTDYLLCCNTSSSANLQGLNEDQIQLINLIIQHFRNQNRQNT